ncbi:cytochrome c biogenesis protein ResB [Blastococcus goldschmidtiae]|uniref:Cytochrome c biogenesis protein ResB n=1 Tax=Blastococcus goldschmidtiae TaxID=3075546 RepID=A0ABU2K7E0_9ACTN|nr:cytochrome c biogenesis protein ResB [Blastococcus sp. DSM 46792]MDT0276104.1 cytochrome c biogenesis protein ResB [Blastococcus sp. DSM 46792]
MTDVQTRPVGPPATAPRGPLLRRLGRWWLRRWRWLTSMRTAVVLLFLLALAAVPGSLFPQRSLTPSAVAGFFRENPDLAPVLDTLGMFDVFSSPWFSAIYLLLFVSLIGCLVPRCIEHLRALRADPPPVPRHLHRLPVHAAEEVSLPAEAAAERVEAHLRSTRFRVTRNRTSAGVEISAERGRVKETGNLVFHLSLLALLVALAGGKLWGYEGSILVTEGDGFCNSFQQYDRYVAGPMVDPDTLTPLCFDLQDFRATYELNGMPASFSADIGVQADPGAPTEQTTIGVNDPFRSDGDRLYVTGHGFTPLFTVTLPDGQVFEELSAPFLPRDSATFASEGVVKLPDLGDGSDDGFALEGFFAPTGVVQGGVLTSVDARPLNPQVAVIGYRGYLGLDSGIPQSVFSLDQTQIDVGALNRIGEANLSVGESAEFEDGTVVRFDGFREFAALQVSYDPGQVGVLISAITMLLGLLATLLVRRERVFARITGSRIPHSGDEPSTTVALAGLARGGSGDVNERLHGLSASLLGEGQPRQRRNG